MIILDNNRNPIGEYYTDKDGRIEYKEPKKNMPYYYVKESQPAKNYYRNYNEYKLAVDKENNGTLIIEVVAKTGKLSVFTRLNNDDSVTGRVRGEPAEGTLIKIYDYKTHKLVSRLVTQANGIAVIDLPFGKL